MGIMRIFGDAAIMGYLVAGLFFLKFWARTRDSLFAVFAASFWLMALNSTLAVVLDIPHENQAILYLLRLAAFLLIIIAIVRKNMGSGSPSSH